MKSQAITTWTNADFLAGQCQAQDIGKPRVADESLEVSEILDKLPPLSLEELDQAALRVARGKLSYDAFFEKYPGFHHKYLLSMARQRTAPAPTPPPMPEVPWLTASRLAYKREQPTLQLVEDAKEVPPSST